MSSRIVHQAPRLCPRSSLAGCPVPRRAQPAIPFEFQDRFCRRAYEIDGLPHAINQFVWLFRYQSLLAFPDHLCKNFLHNSWRRISPSAASDAPLFQARSDPRGSGFHRFPKAQYPDRKARRFVPGCLPSRVACRLPGGGPLASGGSVLLWPQFVEFCSTSLARMAIARASSSLASAPRPVLRSRSA